ncbi:hypothetical protein BCV26_015085 [Vibrio cyclitrophicus]|uniref:hypothetical protein n=1 Tax=Vibrio cyclitrophicus TaxID=47951 RepID=UPI000C862C0A|nr:hypothetical protein [Vibrio cyclitrophicus]PME92967.1 hypothetical protein BCV26_13150 [Vibrio cyclitrophicus]
MNEQIMLSVGQRYPVTLPVGEGAISELMRPFGNCLIIVMPDISEYEEQILRHGELHCGLLEKDGAILLLWQFRDGRTKVITLDSPFDVRLLPDLMMWELNTPESRFCIDVHVVDSRTQLVRGLRSITMPVGLSRELLTAVKKQLNNKSCGQVQMNRWMQKAPHKLAKKTLMWKMGD